jgi:hypothetical protein
MANMAPTPMAVALVLLPALVLMLACSRSSTSGPSTIRRPTRCRWPSSARGRLRRNSTACPVIRSMRARPRPAPTLSLIHDREVYGAPRP